MPAVLYLAHAGVGFLVVLLRLLGAPLQIVRVTAGTLGTALALWAFLVRDEVGPWRSTEADPDLLAVVALGAAAGWLLTLGLPSADWRGSALVGVGSSSLFLASSARWVVPALLFWSVLLLAALATSLPARAPAAALAAAVAVAALTSAWGTQALAAQSWLLAPAVRAGWAPAGTAAAALVAAGLLPRIGVWQLLGRSGACLLPLLVGAGFVFLQQARPNMPLAPVAAGFVVLAMLSWAGAMARQGVRASVAASAVVSLCAAMSLAEGALFPLATSAAVLAVAVVALAVERASPAGVGGLIVGLVPFTAGWLVGAIGVARAFHRMLASSPPEAAAWGAVAVGGVIAWGGLVLIGIHVAQQPRDRRGAGGLLPAAIVAVISLWLGVVAAGSLTDTGVVAPAEALTRLHLVAVVAGGVAAWRAWSAAADDVLVPGPPVLFDDSLRPNRADRLISVLAGALATGAAGAVIWLTYQGLKVGFL